jgi:serine/threonine protein kinase
VFHSSLSERLHEVIIVLVTELSTDPSKVASYTNKTHFGLIMSPVADCNMVTFYDWAAKSGQDLNILREFPGCLANALRYLHSTKIRHKDIAPKNILVKINTTGGIVYFTDFGISHDWQDLPGSTTDEDTEKTWRYCSPEVALRVRRNLASDVWSLGCVFLEIATVLRGFTIEAMQEFFFSATDSNCFHRNVKTAPKWTDILRQEGTALDSQFLEGNWD